MDFLELPKKPSKPRESGITLALDRGYGVRRIRDQLEVASESVDLVKLGWGTGYLTENLEDKLSVYADFDIPVYFGGTLFEVAVLQNQYEDFKKYLKRHKVRYVEVSNGTIDLDLERKNEYIADLSEDFTVLAEIGKKDPKADVYPPVEWIKQIKSNFNAGAWKVIGEGRESGRMGIYREDGEVRFGLIDEVFDEIDSSKVIFETPNKDQQVWFIKRFGSTVNLGNIALEDVIPVETLRRGLRGDTALFFNDQ